MYHVSLEKQIKQLSRDLKKNPGKAAALGLLGIVAVWFWLPLIYKPGDPTPPAPATPTTAATQVPTTPTATTAATPSPTTTETKHPWKDVARWIEHDPNMTPTQVTLTERGGTNPFTISPKVVERAILAAEKLAEANAKAKAQEEEKAKDEQAKKSDEPGEKATTKLQPLPPEYGLTLTSTLIGRGRRTAMISGKVYIEGSEIAFKNGPVFTLLQIELNRVVLKEAGQKYELTVKEDAGSVAANTTAASQP